jgi:protein SCO1/2
VSGERPCRRTIRGALAAFALGPLLAAASNAAAAEPARPPILDQVAFEQRIGEAVPLDTVFRDEAGRSVRLADYVRDKPVLLVPAYYECPMLCTLVLKGVVSALRALSFDVGREFAVVTFSFSPTESPAEAAAEKAETLGTYRRPGAESGWHFLTGSPESIRAVTDAIGFRYARDPASGQYAHASGIVLLTPDGRISRYFYGVEYAPRDLRLALVEAAGGRIGSPVDRLLLYCFEYDATTGRYSRPALRAIRVGGTATVLVLGAFVTVMLRREGTRTNDRKGA